MPCWNKKEYDEEKPRRVLHLFAILKDLASLPKSRWVVVTALSVRRLPQCRIVVLGVVQDWPTPQNDGRFRQMDSCCCQRSVLAEPCQRRTEWWYPPFEELLKECRPKKTKLLLGPSSCWT